VHCLIDMARGVVAGPWPVPCVEDEVGPELDFNQPRSLDLDETGVPLPLDRASTRVTAGETPILDELRKTVDSDDEGKGKKGTTGGGDKKSGDGKKKKGKNKGE